MQKGSQKPACIRGFLLASRAGVASKHGKIATSDETNSLAVCPVLLVHQSLAPAPRRSLVSSRLEATRSDSLASNPEQTHSRQPSAPLPMLDMLARPLLTDSLARLRSGAQSRPHLTFILILHCLSRLTWLHCRGCCGGALLEGAWASLPRTPCPSYLFLPSRTLQPPSVVNHRKKTNLFAGR